jgi:AcrR family transcriptional regulator
MPVAERRLREKEARRQQILDAARELFFKKGFEHTTVEDIAARTELSKGTIYLYFPSKEEITISLMLEGSQILYQMLRASAAADGPADELLRSLGKAYLKFYLEYTEYFRMLFLYYSSIHIHDKISKDLRDRCEQQAKQSLMVVANVIQKGINDGQFQPCNPLEYAIMIWTCMNGMILLAERGDDQLLQLDTSIEKLNERFLQTVLSALRAGTK